MSGSSPSLSKRFPELNNTQFQSQSSRLPQLRGGITSKKTEPKTVGDAKRPGFFQKEWYQLKKTWTTTGSRYNLIVPVVLGFVGCAVILFTIQPFFVKSQEQVPQDIRPNIEYGAHPVQESESIAIGSVLMWSGIGAVAVGLLTFFTRPKPEAEYRVV